MRLEWTRRAAAASGGRATPRPEVHARVRPGSLLRGLVAAGPGPRAACRAQTDSVDDVDVDEADVVLEMPHEVEERYLKLLKRQEGKLKDLQRKHSKKRSTHRVMKISSGYLKGSPVLSPRDKDVRPMMGKVRSAVFSMLLSRIGGGSEFPSECRWLDLFAGTGSVGIEALSRGCGTCHFVELDQWTANEVLIKNIDGLGVQDDCSVHVESVFDFLTKFSYKSEVMGGSFDFVSVCPPYNDMDFDELVRSLEASKVVSDRSFLIFEYPKEVGQSLATTLGPLTRLVNRTYGRTTVAIYGPDL